MAVFLEDLEKFNQNLHCYNTKGLLYTVINSENIQEINFIVIEGICKIYRRVFWETLLQTVAQNTRFKNVYVDTYVYKCICRYSWRSCLERRENCCTLYCLRCSEAQAFCLIEHSITSQIFQSSYKIRYGKEMFYQLVICSDDNSYRQPILNICLSIVPE